MFDFLRYATVAIEIIVSAFVEDDTSGENDSDDDGSDDDDPTSGSEEEDTRTDADNAEESGSEGQNDDNGNGSGSKSDDGDPELDAEGSKGAGSKDGVTASGIDVEEEDGMRDAKELTAAISFILYGDGDSEDEDNIFVDDESDPNPDDYEKSRSQMVFRDLSDSDSDNSSPCSWGIKVVRGGQQTIRIRSRIWEWLGPSRFGKWGWRQYDRGEKRTNLREWTCGFEQAFSSKGKANEVDGAGGGERDDRHNLIAKHVFGKAVLKKMLAAFEKGLDKPKAKVEGKGKGKDTGKRTVILIGMLEQLQVGDEAQIHELTMGSAVSSVGLLLLASNLHKKSCQV